MHLFEKTKTNKQTKQNETKQKRVRSFELVVLVEYHTFHRSAANRSTSPQELSLLDEPRLSYAKTFRSPASQSCAGHNDTVLCRFTHLVQINHHKIKAP